MVKYAYTSMVRSQLTYASFAFADSFTKGHIAKLNQVQRLALMMTGNYRKGTPGKALEVILDIPPLDLYIKSEARKCRFRLIGSSPATESHNGHLQTSGRNLADMNIPLTQSDNIGKDQVWEQRYSVDQHFDGIDIEKGYRCYTDAAKQPKARDRESVL